ncbi:hypothetical protein JCM19046_177 [Bacillus sp. JCM 19046]|nr:hypothetical protein JCM19045_4480 [Bacillus sp. JCM 19045]GAF15778.1 hypothetical protein JCM19046_177 [Bacillus sp. JCM 19046]
MYGWLNIASLVLGLVAWIVPIIYLMKQNKEKNKRWGLTLIVSMSACLMSICFQLLYNDYLVRIEDWSALMDTSKGSVRLSFLLAVGTIFLNSVVAIIYSRKRM